MSLTSFLLPKQIENAISPTWSKIIAWGVGLTGCAIIAPVVFMAIQGLVGFILAVLLGWTALKLAPVVGQMVGNLSLKLIKWESRRNPGETMRQNYIKQERQIKEDRQLAKEFNLDLEGYRPMVASMVRDYPEEAGPYQRHLAGMEETRELFYVAIELAEGALREFDREIKKVDRIWEATQTGARVDKFAQRLGRTDAIAQIQNDEAIRSAQLRMTQTFGNLDDLRRRLRSAPSSKATAKTAELSHNPSPVIHDVVDAKVLTPVSGKDKYN